MEIKRITYFILIFLVFGQNKSIGQKIDTDHLTIKQIDSIRNVEFTNYSIWDRTMEASIELNSKLLEASKKLDYKKGITHAYLGAGNLSCNIGNFKDALNYVKLVEQSEYYKNCECKSLKARISNLKGRIYIGLGYHSFALEELNEGLEYLKNDTSQNLRLSILHVNKAAAFAAIGEKDSVFYSRKRSLGYASSVFNYILMSRWYLNFDKKIDSAKYYLDLSKAELEESKSVPKYGKSIYLRNVANYYEVVGDHKKAIANYCRSLDISMEINRDKEILKTYKNLADLYVKTGDIEKSNSYYSKYAKLNRNIKNNKDRIRDITGREFFKEKEQQHKSDKNQWLTISLSIGIIVIGGGLFSRKYVRTKYKKSVKEKIEELHRVNSLVQEKKQEEKKLKAQLENTQRELVELAKKNDELFLPEFRRVYPELYKKLEEIDPKITKSDLILLGMVWLNFSSKDIANATFVQHRTVQTKKYRLRQKLKLPNGTDLYQWLQKIGLN